MLSRGPSLFPKTTLNVPFCGNPFAANNKEKKRVFQIPFLHLPGTTGNQPAFSPKERVAMKKDTRLKLSPGAILLILVSMLILLAVRKRLTTAEEVDKAVSKVGHAVLRDSHSRAAIIVVVALFAYVTWTVLRANRREAKESSASDKKGEKGDIHYSQKQP
jgi:hypothetical protein